MIRFRNSFPAFSFDSEITVKQEGNTLNFVWKKDGYQALLKAELENKTFEIKGVDPSGEVKSLID